MTDNLQAVRELVAQMRHELAADDSWYYTAYEKGRIAEKQRCLSLLESALAQQPAADAYCFTREDGECISDDPRCIHNKSAAVDGARTSEA